MLENYRIIALTKDIFNQMNSFFKKELVLFNEDTKNTIMEYLKDTIRAKLSLMTVDDYETVVARIKESIKPENIIAQVIL